MTTEPFLFYHSKRQVSGTMEPLKASWLKGLMKSWRNHVPQFIFICTYIFISIYNYHTQSMFVQIKRIKTFDMKRTISIKSYFSHAQFKEWVLTNANLAKFLTVVIRHQHTKFVHPAFGACIKELIRGLLKWDFRAFQGNLTAVEQTLIERFADRWVKKCGHNIVRLSVESSWPMSGKLFLL